MERQTTELSFIFRCVIIRPRDNTPDFYFPGQQVKVRLSRPWFAARRGQYAGVRGGEIWKYAGKNDVESCRNWRAGGLENIKFEIHISKKDLSNFMIYHNYHSLQGAIGLLISIAALILLVVRFNYLDNVQMAVLILLALVFTVLTPLLLMSKAKAQEKRNKSFSKPIEYELSEAGFGLTQGDEHVDIEWRSVYKVVDTGRSVVVYISSVRAFIWPKQQLGSTYSAVLAMLKMHLEPRKIKVK